MCYKARFVKTIIILITFFKINYELNDPKMVIGESNDT